MRSDKLSGEASHAEFAHVQASCGLPAHGSRYIELLEKDKVTFGTSKREYILLNTESGE